MLPVQVAPIFPSLLERGLLSHQGMAAARNSGLREKTHLPVPNVINIREEGQAFVRAHGWLQTVLLVIGLVTVLAVLGAIFIAAGNEPEAIYTDTQIAPVNSALFQPAFRILSTRQSNTEAPSRSSIMAMNSSRR